ncbi:MAG: hypothetical protein II699_03510, partial [Lachnospiraceae bacterium]|nr:hypothetical protein [Lachnospiraceae bacterium]
MDNDTLIGLVDLIKTCSDIEQSPYGNDNPDKRVEELFMTDLLNFFVMLSYSSGDVHKREIKFINKELKYDFNKETLRRYAEENVLPLEKFVNEVPLSFQYFLKAEFVRGKTLYNIYRGSTRKYIKTFREAGQEFIAVDGLVSQEEIEHLNAFCLTLENEVRDYKDRDIYRSYGRKKVSMEKEEEAEEESKPDLSNVRVYEPGRDYERMTVTGNREMPTNRDNEGRDILGGTTEGKLPSSEERLSLADISESIESSTSANDDYSPSSPRLDELLKKLNDMIGLASVKQDVQSLVNKLNVSNLRKAQGLPPLPIEMHMVFTGNP